MINRHIETMTRWGEKAVHAGLFHRAIPWECEQRDTDQITLLRQPRAWPCQAPNTAACLSAEP